MTLLKTIAVAFGAIALAAAIAPASLIDATLAARTQQRIRLTDTTGFWWRGSGVIASADGTQRLPIDWQLDGAAAFRHNREFQHPSLILRSASQARLEG